MPAPIGSPGLGLETPEAAAERDAAIEAEAQARAQAEQEADEARKAQGQEASEAEADDEAEADPPKTPDHRNRIAERRIAKLTAKLKAAEERLAGQKPIEGQETEAQRQAAIDARAREIVEQQRIVSEAKTQAELGVKEYGKEAFNARISALSELVDKDDLESVKRYNGFVAAALDTGMAHKVMFLLGEDPDEAERIMDLAPHRQGIELQKLAGAKVDPITKAPKPISALAGRNAASATISPNDPSRADNLSTAEWMRRRDEQVKKLAEARAGR